MTWPRVGGLRALELGAPGQMREELNRLVQSGRKRATTGLLSEYAEEDEARLVVVEEEARGRLGGSRMDAI